MPIIATDGSSLGTPMPDGTRKAEGHGGWSAVIRFEDDHPIAPGFIQELIGGKRRTTTGENGGAIFDHASGGIVLLRAA